MSYWPHSLTTALALALGGVGFSAIADELPGSAGQPTRKAAPSPSSSEVDERHALRQGVVSALSARGEKIQIQGHWHRIDASRTRLFRHGRLVDGGVLKVGQALKFTLVDATGEPVLGVVYVP